MSPSLEPDAESGEVESAVLVMVAVIVELNAWPIMSVAAYLIAVAVPAKDASGAKVTTPVPVLSVHVPWLATVTEVAKQFGGVSSALHSASRPADLPDAVSFDSGVKVTVLSTAAEPVSGVGLGVAGELTVTSRVELEHDASGVEGAQVPDTVLQISYVTFVAVPENVLRGSNVTVVPLNVQVP